MAEAARLPNISISSSYMRFGGDQEQFDFEIDGSNIQDIAGEFGFPLDDDAADEIAGSFTDIFGPIGEGFEQPDSIFQTELSLQQPLYTFGRISSGIDQPKQVIVLLKPGLKVIDRN